MKNKYNFSLLVLVLLIVFLLMYLLNINTEFVTDDYIYQFVFENRMPSSSTRWLSNPLDLFVSMANHWRLWGGRVTVHFLLQFAFLLGRNFFDIFNSLMFVILGLLIYFHINNTKKIKIPLLVVIYAVIFLLVPQPGATIIWKSGSANYLWSSVFILGLTLILKKAYENEFFFKDSIKNRLIIFIYGLFIGCANENTGCALIVSVVLFTIFYRIKYKKIPQWCLCLLSSLSISYIFLLVAPGNYIRGEEMYPNISYDFFSLIEYTLKITKLTDKYIGIILYTSVISFILSFTKKKNISEFIKEYGMQLIFFSFAFISVYSLVLSPAYPERCWIFAFIFLLINIGMNINYFENGKYSILVKKFSIILMIILSFKSISNFSDAYKDIKDTRYCINDHVNQINKQLNKGIKDVSVKNYPSANNKYNAFNYNGYLTYDSSSWTNSWIAKYYGVSSIILDE